MDARVGSVEEFNRYRATLPVIGDPRIASAPVGGPVRICEAGLSSQILSRRHGMSATEGSDGPLMLISPR